MSSIPQKAPIQLTLFASSEGDMVTCLICGKQMQMVSTWHLRTHGMTCSDYRTIFPGAFFTGQAYRNKQRVIMTDSDRLKAVSRKGKPTGISKRTGIMRNCEICDHPFYVQPGRIKRARFCSLRCSTKAARERIKETNAYRPMYGSDNPQWRGGLDKNYYGPNWSRQRRLARKRDNFICQKCGKAEHDNGRQLDVHHIKDFREFGLECYQEANHLSNLISLCRCCHSGITSSRIVTWPNAK